MNGNKEKLNGILKDMDGKTANPKLKESITKKLKALNDNKIVSK